MGEAAGFASIHHGSLITQFALSEPYRRHGQSSSAQPAPAGAGTGRVRADLRRVLPGPRARRLPHTRQAGVLLRRRPRHAAAPAAGWPLRPAGAGEAEFIRAAAGDFFDRSSSVIAAGELFADGAAGRVRRIRAGRTPLALRAVASIGMYTSSAVAGSASGRPRSRCWSRSAGGCGLRPVAGCWYYNHASKRTLERAGMYPDPAPEDRILILSMIRVHGHGWSSCSRSRPGWAQKSLGWFASARRKYCHSHWARSIARLPTNR